MSNIPTELEPDNEVFSTSTEPFDPNDFKLIIELMEFDNLDETYPGAEAIAKLMEAIAKSKEK